MGSDGMSAERDDWYDSLWKVVAIRRATWGLEEGKCHPGLPKGQEGPRKLPASQPHISPWKGDGVPLCEGYLYPSSITRRRSGVVSIDSVNVSSIWTPWFSSMM